MVKKVVVTQGLSEEMRKAGATLIARLDEIGLPVQAALWRYHEEAEAWRLVIALPGIKSQGSRKAYEQIQAVLLGTPEGESTIGLESISAVDSESTSISELRNRVVVKIQDTVLGAPLGRMVGRDAFVYRL